MFDKCQFKLKFSFHFRLKNSKKKFFLLFFFFCFHFPFIFDSNGILRKFSIQVGLAFILFFFHALSHNCVCTCVVFVCVCVRCANVYAKVKLYQCSGESTISLIKLFFFSCFFLLPSSSPF